MKIVDRYPWLAVSLLVVTLFLFHFFTISYQSYFTDEVEELHFAQGDFWQSVFMPDSMPPLFTLSLRSWITILGNSIDARWLSAGMSLASTFAIYKFMSSLTTARVSLLIASLFAFSPLQLYYAQMIRGYALMTFLSVFCIGFFVLAMNHGRSRCFVAFTIFSVVGMYAHYYFVMIPIALLTAWFCQKRFSDFRRIAICYVAMFVLTCPVLVFLVEDFRYQHNLRDPRPMTVSAVAYTYFAYFSGYALGPSQRELQYIGSAAAIRSALPWLLLVTAIALPLATRGIGALKRKELMVTVVSLLTIPLILIGAAGVLSGITYNVRFVAWFAFPLSVLLGFAFSIESGRQIPAWVIVCGVGLFGIFGCANFNRVFNSRYQFEDARAAAKYLRESRKPGEPIYVVSDYMLQPLLHYFRDAAPVAAGESDAVSEKLLELPEPGTRSRVIRNSDTCTEAMQVVDSNSKGERSWLVYSRPFHGDPDGLLLKEFTERGAKLTHSFAGIDVFLVPAQP